MFPSDSGSVKFPELEARVAKFWKERDIYGKSLAARAGAQRFVFFEGPPTANGMPHPGHCLTRAIKDLFPRYRTMRGYLCERKAGWDTHGLPVEVEVCKELGIHSKEEIEAYGIEPFIHKCQQSVWRYMQEWERLTERLGFWVNLQEAYVTYHQSFIESVWWSLKKLFDQGLLYQGHKIVWWWAQGGTALSSGEVGQGYREVADPSVYVRFPLVDRPDTDLLVWTTTPWTLPSNQFAAVHPDLEYATVDLDGESRKFIVAK
jgi:isoleucyl-tRNA synthetase